MPPGSPPPPAPRPVIRPAPCARACEQRLDLLLFVPDPLQLLLLQSQLLHDLLEHAIRLLVAATEAAREVHGSGVLCRWLLLPARGCCCCWLFFGGLRGPAERRCPPPVRWRRRAGSHAPRTSRSGAPRRAAPGGRAVSHSQPQARSACAACSRSRRRPACARRPRRRSPWPSTP